MHPGWPEITCNHNVFSSVLCLLSLQSTYAQKCHYYVHIGEAIIYQMVCFRCGLKIQDFSSPPCPWLFLSLLGGLPYEFKVVIAGNHELTFDKDFMAELVKQDYYRFPSVSKLKPEDFDNVQSLLTNCVYLQDSDVTIKGFQIYGTPW